MSIATIFAQRIHISVLIIFTAISTASAADLTFRKNLADGRAFELKYSQTAIGLPGNSSFELIDGKSGAKVGSVPASQISGGRPLTNYYYTAIASLAVGSSSSPAPFWTNAGKWGSMTIQLRTGFEFFDAETAGNDLLLCYKEEFGLFVEKLTLSQNGLTTNSRSRHKICLDDTTHGYSPTGAKLVIGSNEAPRVVVTGPLGKFKYDRSPVKKGTERKQDVEQLSWQLEGGHWRLESQGTNILDPAFSVRFTTDSWNWQSNTWVKASPP